MMKLERLKLNIYLTRRTDQLIVIVDPTETTLNDEFRILAQHTEELINLMSRDSYTTTSNSNSDEEDEESDIDNYDAKLAMLSGCELDFQIRELHKTKEKLLKDRQMFFDRIEKNTEQIRVI